jgi:hypothetical protein
MAHGQFYSTRDGRRANGTGYRLVGLASPACVDPDDVCARGMSLGVLPLCPSRLNDRTRGTYVTNGLSTTYKTV